MTILSSFTGIKGQVQTNLAFFYYPVLRDLAVGNLLASGAIPWIL